MKVPDDTDSVCGICKDMVTQARDQLESNQTQQDLKDVFEGSCKLIHIKPIVKECIKLADEFVPDLVETLASQMDPSVVCTVAGLCNSAHIDKLLLEYKGGDAQSKVNILLLNFSFLSHSIFLQFIYLLKFSSSYFIYSLNSIYYCSYFIFFFF